MTRQCELCPEQSSRPATLFCPADECYLCSTCDEEVHSANRLASRHVRQPVEADTEASSFHDESEAALVPDVASVDMMDCPDKNLIAMRSPVPVSFEDAAEYDFCDFEADALGAKMPALCGIDDEDVFEQSKIGKTLYGDLSWENVVSEGFEHVVPDVVELPRTPTLPKREDISASTSPVAVSAVTVSDANDEDAEHSPSSPSSSTDDGIETSPVVQDSPSPPKEEESIEKTEESDEQKTLEHRKKMRQEALARFRSKRANRSFTKRVRYECRKQLADSRPRVKGRFVRKIEMALFRKYGALYREHLDELKNPQLQGDQCVPAL